MARFDHTAIALVRRLCRETGAKVVLSSSWRYHFTPDEVSAALQLPVIDHTPKPHISNYYARGHEIAEWLAAHSGVSHFAIVDDINAMLPDQKWHFVQTDHATGLTLDDYYALETILKAEE